MTLRTFVLGVLASATVIGSVSAEERLTVTPTLYRELARATASVRPAAELTTTPRLVPAAPAKQRVAEAAAR